MSDLGFFGPDSVAWRLHADPSSMVGGIRSLIVQALEPRAMAGVAQHSEFRSDFWGRLRRTNDFLLTIVYGTRAEAEQASAIVRKVHERVEGFDHFSKSSYRAGDPALLTWVHNATVESYLAGYMRHAGASDADADQYVGEMRVLGELMGVDRSTLPADVASLCAYFDSRTTLAASPDAKEAVRILLNPPLPPKLRVLWAVPAADAYASIPAEYRSMYGLPWISPMGIGARVSAHALVRAFRLLLPAPPRIESARARASQQSA